MYLYIYIYIYDISRYPAADQSVALVELAVKGPVRGRRHVVDDDVLDLRREARELRVGPHTFAEVQRLRRVGERPRRLREHETVHHWGQRVQAQFQDAKLVEEGESVPYAAGLSASHPAHSFASIVGCNGPAQLDVIWREVRLVCWNLKFDSAARRARVECVIAIP